MRSFSRTPRSRLEGHDDQSGGSPDHPRASRDLIAASEGWSELAVVHLVLARRSRPIRLALFVAVAVLGWLLSMFPVIVAVTAP